MNYNDMILPGAGADFEEGARVVRSNLQPSQRAWWEENLSHMREGRMDPNVFLYECRRGFAGRTVPFLRETMTRSDFPDILLADTADRTLLAGYAEEPHTWDQFTFRKTNRDTRPSYLNTLNGGEAILKRVNELQSFPEAAVTEGQTTTRAFKYGQKFGFSLESFMNDGLNAFGSIPMKMGRSVRRTQEDIVTKAYATDASKATLFDAAYGNIVTIANGAGLDNPVFGIAGIQAALTLLASKRDADGNLFNVQGSIVVYPSELEIAAQQIRQALWMRGIQLVGTTGQVEIQTNNFLSALVTLVPSYRLSQVAETNPKTNWFLFANPNMGRPALVATDIMGKQSPDLLMKASNAVSIGGGDIGPTSGDFDTDSIAYKVRMFFGADQVDPHAVVMSKGTAVA